MMWPFPSTSATIMPPHAGQEAGCHLRSSPLAPAVATIAWATKGAGEAEQWGQVMSHSPGFGIARVYRAVDLGLLGATDGPPAKLATRSEPIRRPHPLTGAQTHAHPIALTRAAPVKNAKGTPRAT